MDFFGSIISGLFMLFFIMAGVYFVATYPGVMLIIAGVCLGIGVLCWPLIQKLL